MKLVVSTDIETLEKGRKGLPIGTRRIQEQKTKDGIQRWWRKKTAKGWEYDGLVSDKEYKEFMATQKRATKISKKREETKKKVEAARKQREEDEKKRKQQADDGKPTKEQIAKMPTKEKMYWSDPRVTDARRELADATGILTLDDIAENYVRRKMKDVFKMSDAQQQYVAGLDADFPAGTDGKAFDDPVFMEDTINGLKEMKDQLMSSEMKKERSAYLEQEWANLSSWEQSRYGDNVDTFKSELESNLIKTLDTYIEAFESHENDKIVLNKMWHFDRGIRGINALDNLDDTIIESLFGKMRSGDYDELPDGVKTVLQGFGIKKEAWDAREWGVSEARMFCMAAIHDEYRTNVAMPFLETVGNYVNFRKTYKRESGWGSSYNESLHGLEQITDRTDPRYIDVDYLSYRVDKVKRKFNKNTLDFMNNTFRYDMVDTSSDKSRMDRNVAKTQQDLSELNRLLAGSTNNTLSIDNYRSFISSSSTSSVNLSYDNIIQGGQSTGAMRYGLDNSQTLRSIANGLKAMSKRKEFNADAYPNTLQAISDVGKALGDTSVTNATDEAGKIFDGYMEALSRAQRTTVEIHSIPSASAGLQRKRYTHRNPTHTDSIMDVTNKEATGSIAYGSFRKSSRRSYRSGGRTRKKLSNFVNKSAVKGAVRAKMLGALMNAANVRDGIIANIISAIGSNWTLRELVKDQDIVPDWKAGPKVMPLTSKSAYKLSTYGASSTTFQEIMKERYQNSVADELGIDHDLKRTTQQGGATGKPHIVLKTNDKGSDWWQNKINSEWTHDDPRITRGGATWAKGSVEVQNVFDIQYHDYFEKYKKVEEKKGNVQYGWHGTSFVAGSAILRTGFTRGGGLFGDGQYIAKSSSKSAAYLHGGAGRWSRGSGTEGVLLWNRCAMGKTNDGTNPSAAVHDKSIDTVYAGGVTGGFSGTGLQHNEWCVKDRSGVIPLQWVDVRVK